VAHEGDAKKRPYMREEGPKIEKIEKREGKGRVKQESWEGFTEGWLRNDPLRRGTDGENRGATGAPLGRTRRHRNQI